MAKRKTKRRKRTTSEKVVLVLGILIALSMILSLFIGFSGRSRRSDSGSLPVEPSTLVALAVEGASPIVATVVQGATVPFGY